MRKVLVAVDETDASQSVLSVFKSMSPEPESVVLVHVSGPKPELTPEALHQADLRVLTASRTGFDSPGPAPQSFIDYYRKELEKGGRVRVRTMVRGGIPSQEILEIARNEDVDLIIIGDSRRRGLFRFSECSVSSEVEMNATVPVLVAKAQGRKKSIAYDWRGEVYVAQ